MKSKANQMLQEAVMQELNGAADKNGMIPLKLVCRVMSKLRFGGEVETLRSELQEIATKLEEAAGETISMHNPPKGTLADATQELDAAKKTAEDAANKILDAAELLQEIIDKSPLAANQSVNSAIMDIITACNFQDLSGQRISKVNSVLEHIRPRIERLLGILLKGEQLEALQQQTAQQKKDDLLAGPQLPEDASTQQDIDALFNKT